jgi:hypothetical protein
VQKYDIFVESFKFEVIKFIRSRFLLFVAIFFSAKSLKKGFSLLSGLGHFGFKSEITVFRKIIDLKEVTFEKTI